MYNPGSVEHGAPATENVEDRTLGGPTVKELHIDFLLQEEFCANPEFLTRFIRQAAEHVGVDFGQGEQAAKLSDLAAESPDAIEVCILSATSTGKRTWLSFLCHPIGTISVSRF